MCVLASTNDVLVVEVDCRSLGAFPHSRREQKLIAPARVQFVIVPPQDRTQISFIVAYFAIAAPASSVATTAHTGATQPTALPAPSIRRSSAGAKTALPDLSPFQARPLAHSPAGPARTSTH